MEGSFMATTQERSMEVGQQSDLARALNEGRKAAAAAMAAYYRALEKSKHESTQPSGPQDPSPCTSRGQQHE